MKFAVSQMWSVLLSVLLIGFATPEASAIQCQWVHVETKNFRYSVSTRQQVGEQLQYGFESEYTTEELRPILRYYKPTKFEDRAWLGKSDEQRETYVKTTILHPVEVSEASGLIRIPSVKAPDFLPHELIIDATGNIEFVLPPVNSFHQYKEQKDYINTTFGVGSMQSTVSTPMSAMYNYIRSQADGRPDVFLGFLKLYSDMDTVDKLAKGAERYKKDPTKDVVRSFNHPFLGPMTELKMRKLIEFVTENSQGRMLEKDVVKFVKTQDSSFKYFGGTAYRPDLASPQRLVLEVRDAHKDNEALEERVQRVTQFFEKLPAPFAELARLSPFDSVKDFQRLPEHLQGFLAQLFPSKASSWIQYAKDELVANEVFRNFAWPLRDWKSHQSVGMNFSDRQIQHAQRNYTLKLQDAYLSFEKKAITKEQARVLVQGALAQFVVELNLHNEMKKVETRIWTADQDVLRRAQ